MAVWGGDFVIGELGSLRLSQLHLNVSIVTVSNGGAVHLHNCHLGSMAGLTTSGTSMVSLSSMTVPLQQISALYRQALSQPGSTLNLATIILREDPASVQKTGALRVGASGNATTSPPDLLYQLSFGSPVFSVTSGPCQLSNGARCVGRPNGYGINERCMIGVSGGGGLLAPPSIFDVDNNGFDKIMLGCGLGGCSSHPSAVQLAAGTRGYGAEYKGSNQGAYCQASDECNPLNHASDPQTNPKLDYLCETQFGYSRCYGHRTWEGFALTQSETLNWQSDQYNQGSINPMGSDQPHRVCEGAGLCGHLFSAYGLGGGWLICFP
eukprot:COSAG01_NODE_1991_length_8696_cov_971.862743_15_plen_323_part_00